MIVRHKGPRVVSEASQHAAQSLLCKLLFMLGYEKYQDIWGFEVSPYKDWTDRSGRQPTGAKLKDMEGGRICILFPSEWLHAEPGKYAPVCLKPPTTKNSVSPASIHAELFNKMRTFNAEELKLHAETATAQKPTPAPKKEVPPVATPVISGDKLDHLDELICIELMKSVDPCRFVKSTVIVEGVLATGVGNYTEEAILERLNKLGDDPHSYLERDKVTGVLVYFRLKRKEGEAPDLIRLSDLEYEVLKHLMTVCNPNADTPVTFSTFPIKASASAITGAGRALDAKRVIKITHLAGYNKRAVRLISNHPPVVTYPGLGYEDGVVHDVEREILEELEDITPAPMPKPTSAPEKAVEVVPTPAPEVTPEPEVKETPQPEAVTAETDVKEAARKLLVQLSANLESRVVARRNTALEEVEAAFTAQTEALAKLKLTDALKSVEAAKSVALEEMKSRFQPDFEALASDRQAIARTIELLGLE